MVVEQRTGAPAGPLRREGGQLAAAGAGVVARPAQRAAARGRGAGAAGQQRGQLARLPAPRAPRLRDLRAPARLDPLPYPERGCITSCGGKSVRVVLRLSTVREGRSVRHLFRTVLERRFALVRCCGTRSSLSRLDG